MPYLFGFVGIFYLIFDKYLLFYLLKNKQKKFTMFSKLICEPTVQGGKLKVDVNEMNEDGLKGSGEHKVHPNPWIDPYVIFANIALWAFIKC